MDARAGWYGNDPRWGFYDAADNDIPKYGVAPGGPRLTNRMPGIATRDESTARGYYVVAGPNGRRILTVHSDYGPSAAVGRNLDINASAAHELGYTPRNFPTGGGFKMWYVGKDLPTARARAQALRAEIPGYKVFGGRWEPGQPSERPVGRAAAGPVSENPLAAAMARRPLMVSAPALPWFMGGGA